MEKRLGTNFRNSSRLPIGDGPGGVPPRPPVSGKAKGGQRGHKDKGHRREILPPEQVDVFVRCK
jgi:hypothetical protein